jgi:UDP-glucose 4-epimerase
MIKKILVIGGSGFVGSHTADALSCKGYDVSIYDSTPSPWLRDDQKMIIGNILDKESIDKALLGIDCVFHFAAIADLNESNSSPLDTINHNIMGTANLVQASVEAGVERFVYASTMYVYSPYGSFYRATKQSSEILIEEYCRNFPSIEYTFLRYGSLYGPRAQEWNGLRGYIEQILSTKKIDYWGTGKEKREYIHVKDAATLSVAILDGNYKNSAITVTGHQAMSSDELISMIFEITGIAKNINYQASDQNTGHYSITPYRYSPKTAKKIVPDEFTDLGQGILDIVEELSSGK